MEKSFVLLWLLIILFSFTTINAQSVKIGLGGGLSLVQSPDALTNDISDPGAGFSTEYHLGGKIKVSFPLLPLTPYGHITYHKFSGEGSTILGNVETSLSVLSIGLGGEWSFVPSPVSPYVGVEIALNNFGDFEVVAPLPAGTVTEPGESRFGAGIGVGTEITLIPVLNLDISAKYNWFNLVGKDDDEETVSVITLNALILFSSI